MTQRAWRRRRNQMAVVGALYQADGRAYTGYELTIKTGLSSGAVYVALAGLQRAGHVARLAGPGGASRYAWALT